MSIPGNEQKIAGMRLSPGIGLTQRIRRIHDVFRTLAERSRKLPLLVGKPPLLKLWLLTARKAQIAVVVSLLFLTVIAPPAVSEATDRLYPPIVSETKLLGVLDHTKVYPNPLREVRYTQFMTALWIVAITLIVALLIDHIPVAARIGRNRASRLISEAERIAPNEPDRSTRLRQSAEGLLLETPPDIDRNPISATLDSTDVKKTMLLDPKSRPATRFVGSDQRYRVDKALGSGGMGVVHAGFDTLLNRPVALKQLFGHLIRDAEQTERFRQEALALARLSHPHIVAVHDLLEDSGELWIVMEILSGGTLADRITGITPPSVEEALEIACNVAAGLGLAHQNGILHRDV
ncbi:MAG: serine/threonine-protein kinase, partial [Woeseia sp.]